MQVPIAKDFNRALKHFIAFSDNFMMLLDKKIESFHESIAKQHAHNELHPTGAQMKSGYYYRKIAQYTKLRRYYEFMNQLAKEDFQPSSYSVITAQFKAATTSPFEADRPDRSPGKGWRANKEYCASIHLKVKKPSPETIQKQLDKANKANAIVKEESAIDRRKRLKREFFEKRAKEFEARHLNKSKETQTIVKQQFKDVA